MSLPRCLLTLAFTGLLAAQSLSHQLDSALEAWSAPDHPGGAFVLIRDGKIAYRNVSGLANLESKAPIDLKTQFLLASVSKQFTAMAVMMLKERGKLSYEDTLATHCPEFPAWAKTMTIRHLLNHTSGLPDYEELLVGKHGPEFFKPTGTVFDHEYTAAEALAILSKQPALRFTPGEKYEYSNSGYMVLAQIVERVAAVRFAEFMRDRVFQPLGMRDTLVVDERKQNAPRLALSYAQLDGKWIDITASPTNAIYGEDNVVATIEDMQRWDRALEVVKLVKKETLAEAFEPGRLNSGARTEYGFGWQMESYDGHPVVSHTGGWAGYRTWIWRCPELHESMILLTNTNSPRMLDLRKAILQVIHPPRIRSRNLN